MKLFALISPWIVKSSFTVSVELDVISPVTFNVPATTVFPVSEATVNLFVAMSKSPSTPIAFVTLSSSSRVTAALTFIAPFTVTDSFANVSKSGSEE